MRAALLPLGLVLLAALWLGPLPHLATHSFAAHMLMHMGVVAVAVPFIALGVAGRRHDPVRKRPAIWSPIPASIVEFVVVWAWHAPALHHLARHSTAGLVAEQGTFFLSGLYVWLSAFGGGPRLRGERRGAGVLALLLTSMHMTLLGALLALPPRPLYAHEADGARLTAIDDQHLGGAIMLLIGGVSYLLGGLSLIVGLLKQRRGPGTAALPADAGEADRPIPSRAHPVRR